MISNVGGVFAVDGLLRIIALKKPNGAPVYQVDCGKNVHVIFSFIHGAKLML